MQAREKEQEQTTKLVDYAVFNDHGGKIVNDQMFGKFPMVPQIN